MGGKGGKRRPQQVSADVFANNWAIAFGRPREWGKTADRKRHLELVEALRHAGSHMERSLEMCFALGSQDDLVNDFRLALDAADADPGLLAFVRASTAPELYAVCCEAFTKKRRE